MKKHVLRLLFSTALMAVLFVPSAFAETPSITTLEELDKKFNLKTVTEIPENVIPLEFESIEEAEKYLENPTIQPASSITVEKSASFRATKNASLKAVLSYVNRGNGMIDLVSVRSYAIGDASWTWKQHSYTVQRLDGGRSLQVNIRGLLTQAIVVNGQVRIYEYDETRSVEI